MVFKGDNFYPQLGATTLLTLLILYNSIVILFLLGLFHISKFNVKYIYSPSSRLLIAVFVSMYLFNHLYFFWINKWREIVSYFNNNAVSPRTRLLSNTYIIFSIVSILLIYIFKFLKT